MYFTTKNNSIDIVFCTLDTGKLKKNNNKFNFFQATWTEEHNVKNTLTNRTKMNKILFHRFCLFFFYNTIMTKYNNICMFLLRKRPWLPAEGLSRRLHWFGLLLSAASASSPGNEPAVLVSLRSASTNFPRLAFEGLCLVNSVFLCLSVHTCGLLRVCIRHF